MELRIFCPDCGSGDVNIIDYLIGRCLICGLYFDLAEEPIVEKIIRTKPKKKYNEDNDDE